MLKENHKSIVFIITTLTYGGAEIQVSLLAEKLLEKGWGVSIITLTDPKALHEELIAKGIAVSSLGMNGGLPDPRAIIKLSKAIKKLRPSIIHGHMIHSNLLIRITNLLALRKLNIPIICTAHSLKEGGNFLELLYRLTDRFCDLNTNVSQAAVDRYIAVRNTPSNKIRKIYNGIETNQFKYNKKRRISKRIELKLDNNFVWLAAGRLTEAKNFSLLLDSFKRYIDKAKRGYLLIAGEGELRASLDSKIKELGLESKVKMLGNRKDIVDLMCAADAYIMSSLWEGLPLVLLEASSVGLPIVATNVGGNSEVVLHNKTGYLVPSSDSTSLTNAMLKLSSLSSEKRKKLGDSGTKYISNHFGIDTIVDEWITTYIELINYKLNS